MKAVAVTFDYWPDAYTRAFPLMEAKGLVGTWFVDHRTINAGAPCNITRDHLTQLKMSGWTIGAYSGENMVQLFEQDRNAAMDHLATIKAMFRSHGFEVRSLAPNQRAWNQRLRNVCQGLFDRVRVGTQDAPQCLPVADPLWIARGGVASLDNGDTPETVADRIDRFLIEDGDLLQIVIHKIGPIPADHTVSEETFAALVDCLWQHRCANRLRVVGYDEL